MNAKKAKMLRRVARRMAAENGLPVDQHLINTKTGVIRNGKSERGVQLSLKKFVTAGRLVFNVGGAPIIMKEAIDAPARADS